MRVSEEHQDALEGIEEAQGSELVPTEAQHLGSDEVAPTRHQHDDGHDQPVDRDAEERRKDREEDGIVGHRQ